jgi:hypothetical protein
MTTQSGPILPIVQITIQVDPDVDCDIEAVEAAASEFCSSLENLGCYPMLKVAR